MADKSEFEVLTSSPQFDDAKLRTANVFRDVFGQLSDAEWLQTVKRSIREPIIQGVEFPGFPATEMQSLLHGSYGERAIDEAFAFYGYIVSRIGAELRLGPGGRLLDFGSGWGRMLRPFMRRYDLADIYGFEPALPYCAVARRLNPYVCFLTGEHLPNRRIPRACFELVVGYSVFSHLSQEAAAAWLSEIADVLEPGGFGVFTTWGEPYLSYLVAQKRRLEAGEEIHWHHKLTLEKFGDIDAIVQRYRAGEFVWIDMGHTPLYGAAFLSAKQLGSMIAAAALPLEVVRYENDALPQDVFILRRGRDGS